MDRLDLNTILDRNQIITDIKKVLENISSNKYDVRCGRGIYIYGSSGTGKTHFIKSVLKELNYDVIMYNAGDIRNKSVIETITNNTMAEANIISVFQKIAKPIAIVMDEIDGMKMGDKGGINSLIKLIRPKKTKKQKAEDSTINPIICIGTHFMDKKIKELMKVCNVFEIKTPTDEQIEKIIAELIPNIDECLKNKIILFLGGDLRKLALIYTMCCPQNNVLNTDILDNVFKKKTYSEDTKDSTRELLGKYVPLSEHSVFMNETDRTIVGLLWHENIVDYIDKLPKKDGIPLYHKMLQNICYGDNFDRITFKKQIWQLNELSSVTKTFYSNYIFHEWKKNNINNKTNKTFDKDMRFTKVLTKYSTEYNNYTFMQGLCQKIGIDKKDALCYFRDLRKKYTESEILNMHTHCDIAKLDVSRIYRYIDNITNDE